MRWPHQTVSLMYCSLFANGSRQSWHRCWAVEESSAAQTPCSFTVINETPAHQAPLSASMDCFGLSGPCCISFMLSDLYQSVVHIYEVHLRLVFLHLLSVALDINHTSLTPSAAAVAALMDVHQPHYWANTPILQEVGLRSQLVLARVLVVNVNI